jgi:hypothetical protein
LRLVPGISDPARGIGHGHQTIVNLSFRRPEVSRLVPAGRLAEGIPRCGQQTLRLGVVTVLDARGRGRFAQQPVEQFQFSCQRVALRLHLRLRILRHGASLARQDRRANPGHHNCRQHGVDELAPRCDPHPHGQGFAGACLGCAALLCAAPAAVACPALAWDFDWEWQRRHSETGNATLP